MLYTPVPLEDIWRTAPAADDGLVEWRVVGRRAVLVEVGPVQGPSRLVRLSSTDPRDYLDPRFQPGSPLRD